MSGIEIADMQLSLGEDGRSRVEPAGTARFEPVDSVILSIGNKVDAAFGLPAEWNNFAHHPQPRFPIDGISYEVFDPIENRPIEGVFIAGWAREASKGLVGTARKDGINAAHAIMQFLADKPDIQGDHHDNPSLFRQFAHADSV